MRKPILTAETFTRSQEAAIGKIVESRGLQYVLFFPDDKARKPKIRIYSESQELPMVEAHIAPNTTAHDLNQIVVGLCDQWHTRARRH
jgi:hypothetical protein